MEFSSKNRSVRIIMPGREGVSNTLYQFAQSFQKVDKLLDTAIFELEGRTTVRSEGKMPYLEAKSELLDMHLEIAGRDEETQRLYGMLIKPLDEKMTEARDIYNALQVETNRARTIIPRQGAPFFRYPAGGTA